MQNKEKIRIVILAAGKGTRMQSDIPKVLSQVKSKSMIRHLLHSVEKSGIDEHPVIVVGYKKEMVMDECGDKYHYVDQDKLLGTGWAVMQTKNYLENKADHIIVLYGDQPYTSAETIIKITEKHINSGKEITMATVKVSDFSDWRICFNNFSRVVRDEKGKIIRTIEKKDATEEELKITEVNPCYFCFDAKWLWDNLPNLKNENAQNEYYLTDLIKIANRENLEIESVEIDAHEALGANTKEELEVLENLVV